MRNLYLLLIAFALVGCTLADDHSQHLRRRLSIEKKQGFTTITKDHIRRRLASFQKGEFRRPKIYFDLRKLNKQNPSRKAFYAKVFKIVGNWWEQAVWINDSKQEKVRLIQQAVDQKYITKPQGKKSWWNKFDLYVDVKMAPTDGGTLAWAGPLYRHPTSQRPITGDCGITKFGDENFLAAADSVNRAVGTIIHEFGHVMAYISYDDLQKHYTKWDNARKSWMWTGPVARRHAAEYYGCKANDIKGILLQTMNDGSVGAHVSEPIFSDELITPVSGADPEKMSAISLGMLEDTKWYKADYSMVENYTYMKDHPEQCKQDQLCPKDRSCNTGDDNMILSDYKGIGYCSIDEYGCPREKRYGNRDVMKPMKWPKSLKKYGMNFNETSFIVQGRFIKFEGSSFFTVEQVPVTGYCDNAQTSYTMRFKNYKYDLNSNSYKGDRVVKCTRGGRKVWFNAGDENKKGEYSSYVQCFDPSKFCKARFSNIGAMGKGFKKCHNSCMKNGRCHPNLPQVAKQNKRRLVFLKEEQVEKLASFYPDAPKSRRRMQVESTETTTVTTTSTNDKPSVKVTIKKNPKTSSEITKKVATMSTAQKSKKAKDLVKDCKKMSKTKKCGPGHGFCRAGWCHKKTGECGSTKRYKKNSNKKYMAKAACKQLTHIKKSLKKFNLKKAKRTAHAKKVAQWGNWDTQGSEWGDWTTEPAQEEQPAAEEPVKAVPAKVVVVKKPKAKPAVKPPKPAPIAQETPDQRHKKDVSERPSAKDTIILKKAARKGSWRCWCYSDYKEHGICPNLKEDIDSSM